ncbi:MAG: amidase [Deltaproteobacteria bacterium]|nr:amidase [Deltaproteobacteria bacterium]MBW1736251.1 amidase [Deltaproteobacteria bacterium]MBW1908320.1 amidase [Deltaproteobacteria bacterium]MBW2032599.1 amidase [Deltaproteobacteria bacterium]MBW2113570.1 amidase [Deltaproteobacteria bacterium]
MTSIYYKSAQELVQLVRSKELSPVELMGETLKRLEAVNPTLNAFVAIRAEQAMEEAKDMAERIASGDDPGPLAGIPIGVKDLEEVKGMVTSFGSIPYRDNLALQDSVQVDRLKAAGAIVVGKTNTPEFAFTGFTKNRLYGVTRNPWNKERTPGGSSGGSAAAVASGMVPLATGSDAGGSIRIPACYSGCFGLKPSNGRIPLAPMHLLYMSGVWTLGPLSRTVRDAALYLDCAAGYHPADPGSLPPPGISYVECLDKLPGGLRIGFSPTLGYALVEKDVMALVEQAVNAFEDMGHSIEIWEGQLPEVSQAWSDLTLCDIYAQVHTDLENIRSEMGRTLVTSLDYAKGLSVNDYIGIQRIRIELNGALQEFFDRFDLLLTPTLPTEAFAAQGPPPKEINGHPIPLLWAVAFTYPFNLSGHPAATVRAGFTETGLPAGLQIIGPRHRDDLVLQAAYAYEQACPWNDHWPDI